MKVYSPSFEREVKITPVCYSADKGIYGYDHDSLLNLVYVQFRNELKVDLQVFHSSPSYTSLAVILERINSGDRVIGLSDVNTNESSLKDDGRSKRSKEIIKWHPMQFAYNQAFDSAVLQMFGLPKNLLESDYPDIVNEIVKRNDDKKFNENRTVATDQIFSDLKTTVSEMSNEELEKEYEDFKDKTFSAGKFANKTFEQVWDESNSYFTSYIRNNNGKWSADAKRYLEVREERDRRNGMEIA